MVDSASDPLVSVVLPTYNRASALRYAIASVLDQSFEDFELWVVGDACTDESEDVVTSLGDPRVRWVNLTRNTGHQAGPNQEGLRRARGRYVAYMGHDDLWLPNHLELLAEALEGGAAFAHCTTLLVLPGRKPRPNPWPDWVYRPGAAMTPVSVMHRRGVVEEAGGWQPPGRHTSHEPEGDLWARVARRHGPPLWVRRITSVKLGTSRRKDVYLTRPCFEQEHWLKRIREAGDAEQALLATCDARYTLAGPFEEPDAPTWPRRLATRWRARLRSLRGRPAETAEERWRARRRFKGLEP